MSAVDYTELDCKLFVGSAPALGSAEDLRDAVAAAVGGAVDHFQVEAGGLGVIVGDNEDADPGEPGDFLALPYIAEVYFAPDSDHAARVAAVAGLMAALRSRGAAVEAACDYEDELPGR
jgi:hypothetical protein